MQKDLKLIKKKYGEEMMHLCRNLFPTLLETEGVLSELLISHFHENHCLAHDILKNDMVYFFKNYIYSLLDIKNKHTLKVDKTPEELLKEAGYQLYECHTEEDIQSFKKYYAVGEELCTFRDDRLSRCYVFFAVKENVDEIKRENFQIPHRQDEYGTSVISIQFTKDSSHSLSIKNRYNHKVKNPDSTFSNNLDNIVTGLTDSFAKYYGMKQRNRYNHFELPDYICADDGKFYKFNIELNDIYYCDDNIIIDNLQVKKYPKEKYLVFDYFILDLENKKINLYDHYIFDCFPETLENIEKISIQKSKEKKMIFMKRK